MRLLTILIAAGLFLFLPLLSAARDLPDGAWIMAEINERNRALKDFSADMDISFYACLMKMGARAKVYYKKPDKVKLTFTSVPEFMYAYRKSFKSLVPAETLRRNYKARTLGIEEHKGVSCYALKLTPPAKGALKEAYVWVDREKFVARRFLIAYRNGGIVEIENTFSPEEVTAVSLIERQKISFRLPEIHARAIVRYRHYKINQNLPDSLFDEKTTGDR